MLPLITAALSILGKKGERDAQNKQNLVNASMGQPAQAGGGAQESKGNGLQDILGLLGSAKGLQPVKEDPMNTLDSLGVNGQNAPSNEDLLSDY